MIFLSGATGAPLESSCWSGKSEIMKDKVIILMYIRAAAWS